MKLSRISIKNFKGIKDIDLKIGNSRIMQIVGINESGKTTILEAINFIKKYKEFDDYSKLIPSDKKNSFNESINLLYSFNLSNDDWKEIIYLFLKEKKYEINEESFQKDLKMEIKLPYVNSIIQKEQINELWQTNIFVKTKNMKSYKNLYKYDYETWENIIKYINKKLLEKLLFIPYDIHNFKNEYKIFNLFDADEISILNNLYKKINNIDEDIHSTFRKIESDKTLKTIYESRILNLEKHLNKLFLSKWGSFLGSNSNLIKFKISTNYEDKSISLNVIEDDNIMENISQRSLGFRWLFGFILHTFSLGSENSIILIDEPASNLHPRAQKLLMNYFEEIATKQNNYIIYTTHSSYLVNPKFLENTYVAKNILSNNMNHDFFNLNSTSKNIELIKFTKLVNDTDKEFHYFYQPIIDALEIPINSFNFTNDFFVILEGKTDQIILSFFDEYLKRNLNINYVPCKNAKSTESLISILLSFGKKFIVLYDGDEEGRRYKNENNDSFMIDFCYTYNDIFCNEKNIKTESLISKNFCENNNLKTKNSKISFITKLLLTKEKYEFDSETISNFEKVFNFIESKKNKNKDY